MPLVFDERQLLAPGVQDATLEEIDRHFARFQKTDKRIKLFESLRAYLGEVTKAFAGCQVIIDGSFVMPCVDEPGDIDLILVLPADIVVCRQYRRVQSALESLRREVESKNKRKFEMLSESYTVDDYHKGACGSLYWPSPSVQAEPGASILDRAIARYAESSRFEA